MNYINAHATSTLVGDVAEVRAVKKVFSDFKNIKMNGTKSMIGHSLGAAGGLEAVATIQAIRTGWVHPTINQARCVPPPCTIGFMRLVVALIIGPCLLDSCVHQGAVTVTACYDECCSIRVLIERVCREIW